MSNALSAAPATSLSTSIASRFVRGGRVTKWKGKAASCAPWIGAGFAASLASSVSSAALTTALAFGGALLGTVTPAAAGSCTAGPASVCSGAAGADVTQVRTGTPLTVTTIAGFGINTAVGNALTLTGTNGTTVTDANSSAIKGAANGILARNLGTGAVSITTTGVVTGVANIGLYGRNAVTGNGLTILAGGNVSGGTAGVVGFNYGAGAVRVTTLGTVTGGTLNGIWATNRGGAAATSLVVTARGNVAANGVAGVSGNGILSVNTGTGIHTVTSYGTIIATRDGIRANNGGIGYAVSTGTTLTVDARNTIIAGRDGINARNYSANAVMSITTSAAATVTGNRDGIAALNNGRQSLTINASGDVTGTTRYGITAVNSGLLSTDLIITTANVTAGTSGVVTRNYGVGNTGIDTSGGTVTGDNDGNGTGDGIYARSNVFGGNGGLTITTADVRAGQDGVRAVASGLGDTMIDTTAGSVTGDTDGNGYGNGIYGSSQNANGGALTITSADVTGGSSGIKAVNSGLGVTVIDTTAGTVTGLGLAYGGDRGIDVRVANVAAGALTITTADVNGEGNGVSVRNYGAGGTVIDTSAGTVIGDTNGDLDGSGIYALNLATAGGSLVITSADVTGGRDGIYASNQGAGDLAITSTGTVTGTINEGIRASNSANGTNLTIAALNASGGSEGIRADNYGSGDLLITSTGTAAGTVSDGIEATNNGGALTIDAVNAIGGERGINAIQYGSGDLDVTVRGLVTGTADEGISASNASGNPASATVIVITDLAEVAGNNTGIRASSTSPQAITITNDGTVRNLSSLSTASAITTYGGPTAITNNDLVLGTVKTGDVADSFGNTAGATWNTAGGTNDFGADTDAVNNSGVVRAANSIGLAETTTFNNLETFTNNATGALRMNDGAVGDRTVLTGGGGVGNFAGNGGGIYVDTLLNAGGNPFADSDVLVIGGDSSGSSRLFVSAAGAGALTPGDGILVVQVDGASDGVFSLGNPDFVTSGGVGLLTAGAFAYKLFQNGLADPADGDWYLRSNYLPTIPTYESYAQVLLGLNNLPTLQQRVGNRFWAGEGNTVIAQGDGGPSSAPEAAPSPEETAASVFIEENAIWTRIEGAHGHYEPEVSTTGAQFDASQWKAQAGIDFMLTENGDGKLIGGLTAHYGQASADVAATAGDGSIDATGYGLGATLTWYGNNGFYVDTQASYSWYDSDLASDDFASSVEGNDGNGYALSIETGKRIDLNNGWTTTPQAQLVYSKVDFDDFTGPLGELVSLQQADSLRGRLGITADREASWQGDGGDLRRSHLYAIANLHYEFLDGAEIDVAGTSFVQRQDRLWGELGLGGSYNWADDKYSVYGEADISTSLTNFGDSYKLSGTAGLRVKF